MTGTAGNLSPEVLPEVLVPTGKESEDKEVGDLAKKLAVQMAIPEEEEGGPISEAVTVSEPQDPSATRLPGEMKTREDKEQERALVEDTSAGTNHSKRQDGAPDERSASTPNGT